MSDRLLDYMLVVAPSEYGETEPNRLINRFPLVDHEDFPLAILGNVTDFALPAGAAWARRRRRGDGTDPAYFSFVLTGSDGYHTFGACLMFWEALTREEQEQDALDRDDRRRSGGGGGGGSDSGVGSGSGSGGGSGGSGGGRAWPSGDGSGDGSDAPPWLTPKSLCILSHHPFTRLFYDFLGQLHSLTTRLRVLRLPIERYICNFVCETPLPFPGQRLEVPFRATPSVPVAALASPTSHATVGTSGSGSRSVFGREGSGEDLMGPDIVSTGMDLDPLIFDRAVSSALPMVPIEFFTSLFSLLSPNIVTSLVSLLLMESPLLLVSRELSALTNISEALCALLFPLSWCGIYIPVTPRGFDLDAALEAPLPFIIGTNVGDHTSAEGTAGGDHVGLSAETLEVCMRCKVTIVDIDGDRLISENYAIIRGTSWDVREAATAAAADRRRRSEGHFLPIPSEDPVAAARKGGHNGPAMMPLPGRTDRSWSVAGLGIPEPFLSRMTSSVAAASRGIPVPEETRKRWGSKARRTTLSGLADDLLIRRSSIDASSGGGRYSSGRGQGAGGGGGNSRGGNGRGNGRSGNGRSGNGGGGGGGDGSTPMWECRDGRHNKWERVSGNVGVDTLAASPMKRLAEAFERRRALQAARPTEEDDAHRREAARFKAKTCRAALQSLVNVWIDPAAAAGACADGRGGGGQGGGVSGRVGGGGDVRRLVNDVRACFLEFFLQILSNYDRYLPKPPAPGTKQTRQQMNETFDAEAFLRNRTVASSFLRRLVTTQMFAVLTYAAQMARLPSTEETEGTEGIMEARLFDSLLDSTEWRNHRAEPKAYLRWRGELSVRGSTAGVSLSERGGGVGGMGRSGGVGSRTSDGRGGQRSTRTLRPTQKVRSLKQSSSAPSGISLKGINPMGRARGLGGGPRSASVPRRPLLVRAMPPSGATCADDSALPMLNVYGREGGSGGSDGRATDGYLGGGGARGHFPRLSLRYFLSPRPLSGPPVVDVPPLSAVPFAVIVESDTSSPVTPGERRRTSYGDLSRPRPALLAKLAKLRVDIDREDRGGGGEDSDDTTTDSDDSEGAVEAVPTFGVEPDVPMAQVT